jgi:integrase
LEKALPKVKMLPGERHRERVLTPNEEDVYFKGASSDAMLQYADSALLRDVATILLDCGLRPEECFRLRTENVLNGKLAIHFGKTENARWRIPMTPRVKAMLEMRLAKLGGSAWVFPAHTKSGHIEPSSLKKQHLKAIAEATRILRQESQSEDRKLDPFELYTMRHTWLTRWAPHMGPWTLAYLAGHRDMNITKRYIHPQEQTIRDAMERAHIAKGGHTSGHTAAKPKNAAPAILAVLN